MNLPGRPTSTAAINDESSPTPRPITRRQIVFLPPALGAIAAEAATAVTVGGDTHGHHQGALPPAVSDFQGEMNTGMAAMMSAMHAPGYSGDADIDFLAMMVPHHQGAVDMARLVLQHGRDPVTRQLAEEIIAGQTVEIESMKRRLALLRKEVCTQAPEFPSLGGTRGP
ncbi:hypothetical protein FHT39_000744 [Mitsuaria sp. BK045]|uniref:CopM family metallochaperone n=1 Tax=unclassified Roseateles TaxID=2626991 RepID=UPI001614F3BA|nr:MULTISPECIES: DUF305 domain-containing protein [unclassified Roseateles]MBB3292105.1 hypothetical protein [Mitsuaria sp. BK041]MBB3361322.1 hypothetical protein [Mitsuaria sp. BK045]